MITRTVKLDDSALFNTSCRDISSCLGSCTPPVASSADDYLFFDIETTGLSPKDSYLYLIGCIYETAEGPVLTQLFSEDISEESLIINEFCDLLRAHDILIHYNGSTFDVPFLNARAAANGISLPPVRAQVDIYKEIKPLKNIFGLKSLRMKAVEELLGIAREDMYDGGELIEFYIKYSALKKINRIKKSEDRDFSLYGSAFSDNTGLRRIGNTDCRELLRLLLLHNCEDVVNMLELSRLLSVCGFFSGAFTVGEVSTGSAGSGVFIDLYPDDPAVIGLLTRFLGTRTRTRFGNSGSSTAAQPGSGHFTLSVSVPGSSNLTVKCTVSPVSSVRLELETYAEEMKLFFPDYKNYYYLIYEDYAVHKSIGQFIDKERCVKCTAANCYTRKTGEFLPVPAKKGGALADRLYLYRRNAPDKTCFVLADDLISNAEAAEMYVLQLFGP